MYKYLFTRFLQQKSATIPTIYYIVGTYTHYTASIIACPKYEYKLNLMFEL